MTLRRYKEIKRMLRLNFELYDRENQPEEDKAWKIRTITELTRAAFAAVMPAPGREISVDEGMVRFTGSRCPIKRVMPNKPIKTGFKFFRSADRRGGKVCVGMFRTRGTTYHKKKNK